MRTLLLFACVVISCDAFAQSPADKLIQEAQSAPTLEKNLRVLTDEIGGRVPGTPAMEKAVKWGFDAFRAAGADDVKVESYSIPHSWQEGATRVSITSPAQFNLRAVSVGWAPSSNGPVKA